MDTILLTHTMVTIIVCLLFVTLSRHVEAKVTVESEAPMENVDEKGILSVHCVVSDISEGQNVKIVRQPIGGNIPQLLTLNEVVQTYDDERVFLAKRQMAGNKFVYFLSIIDVTRKDEGTYSCQVTTPTLTAVDISASDEVKVKVNYFPDETNPVCTHDMGNGHELIVDEGDMVNLNCTSARGHPTVDLRWKRSENVLESFESPSGEGLVSEILRFQASRSDHKSMFICEIISDAYPGRKSTCHVGPVTVRFQSNGDNVIDIHSPVQITSDVEITPPTDVITKKPPVIISEDNCKDVCSLSSGPGFFWIVSTVVAGCLALIFLIIGSVLLLKYHRMSGNTYEENFLQTRPDDFYEKLQYGNHEEMVYMSLGNANRLKGKGSNEVHYCLAPNKASYVGSVRPTAN